MRTPVSGLSSGPYDLVVVGGGINGAGVARDAALRGLNVLLVERSDFASGTSSRSSKLVHGGARYLEYGAFHLVHESCRERRLLQRLAPHLVRPLPFLMPVYRDDRRSLGMIRIGMILYDGLAAFRNTRAHRMLGPESVLAREPGLRADGLEGAALFYDCQMDDARLVVENVLDAVLHGAHAVNHAAVRGFAKSNGRITGVAIEDLLDGTVREIGARVVVNLTGPWVDHVRRLDDPDAPATVRPTKGVHVLVPPFTDHAVGLRTRSDGRAFFALPWAGHTMIGTTDTDWDGPLDDVAADDADLDYLLTEAAGAFPGADLARGRVVSSFAGLRPLLHEEGKRASSVTREHRIVQSPSGLLSMLGGKYTTYRSMAAQIVDRVADRIPGGSSVGCSTGRRSLPGGNTGPIEVFEDEGVRQQGARHGIGRRAARGLLGRYGSRTGEVLALVEEDASLAEPIVPGGPPFLRAEVVFAARSEGARTLEDVLRRRTWLALAPGRGLDGADDVAGLLARELGWSAAERTRQIDAYRRRVQAGAA